MASALSFTLMTVLIREVAVEIHPFEIAFFRAVTNLLLMVPFVIRNGIEVFQSENHKAYAGRGVMGLIFLMTYFSGAALIPVSDSQALIFSSPLWASLLAVYFLSEKLKLSRVTALTIGFCGALIILRPGFDMVDFGAGLVLIASIANAASNVLVKFTTRTDHPDKAVLFLMIYVTPLILIPALFVWVIPTWSQLGLMIAIGFFATLNQRFLSRAFASADATAILPFDFVRLPFAALMGWLVFAETPDMWVWFGGALIFGASIYIARKEANG